MDRKFIKRAGAFGTTPPKPPVPNSNLPSKAPVSPPTGQGVPTPSPTPPGPPKELTEAPGASKPSPEPDIKPRTPELGGNVPTDVSIDAATGHVTIKKPSVNITISKYDPKNPPDKVKHLSEKEQRQWVHVYNSAADKGDDEETAHKKAWGTVPDKNKKTKESATWNTDNIENDPDYSGLSYQEMKHNNINKARQLGKSDYKHNQIGRTVFDDPEEEQAYYEGIALAEEEENVGFGNNDPRNIDEDLFGDFDRFAKRATHEDWKDLLDTEDLNYGDWKEETEYSKDQHDNPFSLPANRRTPPLFTVKATVPEYMNVKNIAYVLQTSTMLKVETSGQTLTIEDVSSPLSLITELATYGIDAEVQGKNLTEFDQGMDDFKLGQKVALLGDYEDMNYFYDPSLPAAQAMIVGRNKDRLILENDRWGRFEANIREIGHVR